MVVFDFDYMLSIWPLLLRASWLTVVATIAGSLIAALIGLLLAVMRRSKVKLIRYPAAVYVEFVRSTPLLIQLFFIFYVLPLYGIQMPPLATGILSIGLYYATYMSEVYRAGIEAVPRGQWEASYTLNMTRFQTWTRIVLPQALPPVVPQLGNYVIAMFKHTPLFAMIGVMELLGTALFEAGRNYRYYEPLTIVGIIFLVYSLIASAALKKLELYYARRR